ncbi:MAG TPA: PhoU domain-containing protein [Rubrobacteraceae bacterium]|nr:PhoU domain-containing protein [Rubrobacteraceae bacterium]
MSRATFQKELDGLTDEVLSLGAEVEEALAIMVRAMEENDDAAAAQVVGRDARYKERGIELDQECMILQARQAPVARDLRLIYTVQALTNHMVRAGTLTEHICQAITETAGCERDEELAATLLEMARTAKNLFHRGLEIFKAQDAESARNLQAADDKVDLLYSEAINLIANPSPGGGGAPEWRMRAALMVHYLERIGDHGVSIGGRTVFLVTGERIESAMRQYLDREIGDE